MAQYDHIHCYYMPYALNNKAFFQVPYEKYIVPNRGIMVHLFLTQGLPTQETCAIH